MRQAIRIIGIDPGLRRTGWGVVETLGNTLRFVASGTVRSDDTLDLASRLRQLHDGLEEVVHAQQPCEAAVEQTFVNKDAVATLKLGQARGIAMLVPARAGSAGRRIFAQRREKGRHRRRARREKADPYDGQGAAAARPFRHRRRGRRTGDRHLPCASPGERGAAGGRLTARLFLTCSVPAATHYSRGIIMGVTEKGQVTIPKSIRRRPGIGPGSEVDLVERASIVLPEKRPVRSPRSGRSFDESAASIAATFDRERMDGKAHADRLRGPRDDLDAH